MDHNLGNINHTDIPPFADLLHKCKNGNVDLDLMIHSPGGDIDTAEKIIYMCRNCAHSFRLIVPESAKSAATLIGLGADTIAMGYTSELGPIDPQISITTANGIIMKRPAQSFLDGLENIKKAATAEGGLNPAYFPLLDHLDPALIDFCAKSIARSQDFAKKWLKRHMLSDDPDKAESVAEQLSDVKRYLSHGIAIDAREAQNIGLKIEYLEKGDPLWDYIWRLHTDYLIDIARNNCIKLFESTDISIPVFD